VEKGLSVSASASTEALLMVEIVVHAGSLGQLIAERLSLRVAWVQAQGHGHGIASFMEMRLDGQFRSQVDPGIGPSRQGRVDRHLEMLNCPGGIAVARKQVAELFLRTGQIGDRV
jgi:hypothetical protein